MTTNDRPGTARGSGTRPKTTGGTSKNSVRLDPDTLPVLRRPELDPTLAARLAALREADQESQKMAWREVAHRGVELLGLAGADFTVEDLRRLGVPEPTHPSQWGGVFVAAHREGLIRCVGSAPAGRRPRHRSLNRVWAGVIEAGEAA